MNAILKNMLSTILLFGLSLSLCHAQSKRELLLEGDFMYETENYSDAEGFYQEAVNKDPDFQTYFNLGVSQEKQIPIGPNETAQQAMQQPEENPNVQIALGNYQSALSFAKDDTERSMVLYNMGNTLLADQQSMSIEKLEEAVENYKAAIRHDKNNDPARHNLSLAQVMLDRAKQQEQQQQEQQQQQDSENSESEEEQEQEEQEQQEEQNEEEQEEKEQEQKEQKSEEQKQEEMEAQKQKVDKKEIENILKMVEQEDKEVQQKMRKQTSSEETTKKKKW